MRADPRTPEQRAITTVIGGYYHCLLDTVSMNGGEDRVVDHAAPLVGGTGSVMETPAVGVPRPRRPMYRGERASAGVVAEHCMISG